MRKDPILVRNHNLKLELMRTVLWRLFTDILDENYIISLYDEEENITRSWNESCEELIDIMFEYDDATTLEIYKGDNLNKRIGFIQCVLCNDPWEIINDHTANPTIDRLVTRTIDYCEALQAIWKYDLEFYNENNIKPY